MELPENFDFDAVLARMEARGKGGKGDVAAQTNPDTKIVPLPIWPDGFRGVPNGILRSALFGAIKRGRRAFQNNETKASLKGVVIRYTGQQLDQADLDVWEYCLHICREKGLGIVLEFSTYQCLKGINRAQGGRNAEWLRSVLQRLLTGAISVEEGRFRYSGTLIHHYLYNGEQRKNTVVLNPNLISIYHAGWTQIEWEQREKLRGHPLAQWMHGFYCTHANPYPIRMTTLHNLSGSENESMHSFKRSVTDAVNELNEKLEWKCHLDEKGLVHIDRPATASQERYIHNSGNAYSRE